MALSNAHPQKNRIMYLTYIQSLKSPKYINFTQGNNMKKFNLFNEIITSNTKELQNAINSGNEFGINIYGDIIKPPYTNKDILIFTGIVDKSLKLEDSLGSKYQIVKAEERVLIKAFGNWQEIIAFNTPLSSYDDTTADGVAEFSDKDLEEIGWQATEFSISYRTLVEFLEEKVEGITLCIEQDEPYQFSGFGFITNNQQAKDVMFEFCKAVIKEKLEHDDDFKEEYLEDDQIKAREFFGL